MLWHPSCYYSWFVKSFYIFIELQILLDWIQIGVPGSPLLGLWSRTGQSRLSSQCTLEWDNYFVLHVYRCQYYTCFKFAYSYPSNSLWLQLFLCLICTKPVWLLTLLLTSSFLYWNSFLFPGHIFVIFVIRFHHQFKYKIYSRLIEKFLSFFL